MHPRIFLCLLSFLCHLVTDVTTFSLQIPKSAEEINLKMPTDMSYVFSGAFSPPICKFIEQVVFFINIII